MYQYLALGAGILLSGYGKQQADEAQADAERANASFYREQAKFAKDAGDRARMIFDRESVIIFGEQRSALAKAGIDATTSAKFMAEQLLYRQQESLAIEKEADLNMRLALLRADEAEATARQLEGTSDDIMGMFASGLEKFGSVL